MPVATGTTKNENRSASRVKDWLSLVLIARANNLTW